MNPVRYQELLSRLLDGELTQTEAEELARGLSGSPTLREDLRQHLVLWEVWSQQQTPERSADSFVKAWKTRLHAPSESAGAFSDAARTRLQASGMIESWIRACLATVRHPVRIAWAASLMLVGLVALFWLASPRSTQAMVTISGDAVCTACVLHESHEHLPVIRVTQGGAAQNYYLVRNPAVTGLQDYFCGGPTPATAKGTCKTSHGRRLFNAAVVTLPDSAKPKGQSTNDVRSIFPI